MSLLKRPRGRSPALPFVSIVGTEQALKASGNDSPFSKRAGSERAPRPRLQGWFSVQSRRVAQRRAAMGHLFQAFSLLVTRALRSADIFWARGGGRGLEWELEEVNGLVMLEAESRPLPSGCG